ncbi:MAG: AAA family ATPase [Firmicutes bacterium]|nr:AAA family ATPase [Bacillota bacterium]
MQGKDFEQEQKWLDYVYKEIDQQVAKQQEKTSGFEQDMLHIRSVLREEYGISSASPGKMMDVAQRIAELRHSASEFGIQHKLLKQLQAVRRSPYFGRIDFHEEGLPNSEPIYVGIRSLIEEETGLPLVYDWRAPISSMFYDFGLGEAEYEGPGGVYRGHISLKRQFGIRERKLVYMFDNELKIDDEILQQALGQNTSEKMRTIVNTIQREQNQAIRNDTDHLLLVEGPAGSGKTSVALHRVAYLLYRYRETISSQNIVIFSPNRIFSDYISNVLPELGEENVIQLTFQHFSQLFLKWQWDVETQVTYLEKLLQLDDEKRNKRLQETAFKSSAEFQEVLDNLVETVHEEVSRFQDVRLGQTLVMSAAEQRRLFEENYSYLPAHRRLRQIYQRIWFLLRPLRKKSLRKVFQTVQADPAFEGESWMTVAREAVKRLRAELEPTLHLLATRYHIDSLAWYQRLHQDEQLWMKVAGGLAQPEQLRKLDVIPFEDVAPLLYLTGELEGYPVQHGIQHVVVDEVQDYAPLQLEIMLRTYPRAKFTFVGDVFQSLNAYVWQSSHLRLDDVFSELGLKTVRLNKSYRSTEEIFNFCGGLLANNQSTETVLRNGRKPVVWKGEEGSIQLLADLIRQNLQAGYQTIAVIGKTSEECQTIYERLKDYDSGLDISLLVHEDATFAKGVLVVPVFLAKGLEFDAVIIPDASQQVYGKAYERRLLYVACSRALHRLDLIYSGQLSPFVEAVPARFYELELQGKI